MRSAAKMLLFVASATVAVGVSACSHPLRPEPAAAAVAPVPAEPDPFQAGSTSFVVAGPHFTPGEAAIVKVCVSPSGIISSADLVGSSGDKRFDDFALVWARQVKLAAPVPAPATTRDVCGPVRVEIRAAPAPSGLGGRDNALS